MVTLALQWIKQNKTRMEKTTIFKNGEFVLIMDGNNIGDFSLTLFKC